MECRELQNALTLVDGFEQVLAQRLLFHPLLARIAGLGAITLLLDANGIQPTTGAVNGFAAQYVAQSHSQKNQQENDQRGNKNRHAVSPDLRARIHGFWRPKTEHPCYQGCPSLSRINPGAPGSTAEIIQQYVLILDTQILEHLDDSRIHHRRATHIKLALFGGLMIPQVVFVEDVVDEAGIALPVILGLRIAQRHMPGEVRTLGGQTVEIFDIEHLANRTGAIPEADLAGRRQSLELVEDVRAHRRHPGLSLLGKELAEWPGDGHLIPRFE